LQFLDVDKIGGNYNLKLDYNVSIQLSQLNLELEWR